MTKSLKDKIKKIKLFIMDVDGVLSDGRIILDADGKETKNFDVQDGFGIVLLQKCGFKTAIISARSAGSVRFRARDLKIDKVYQDAYPKFAAYQSLLKESRLTDSDVCFIGDDLPDLVILNRVGFAVAVSNAVAEVKTAADYVTMKSGGRGAVREVVELILKTHGKWEEIIKIFNQGGT